MNKTTSSTLTSAYNYLFIAWMGTPPNKINAAAKRVLNPALFPPDIKLSFTKRCFFAVRGITTLIPLIRNVSDFVTQRLLGASLEAPVITGTAPRRIDREYRVFSNASQINRKLAKERQRADRMGKKEIRPLTHFAQKVGRQLPSWVEKARNSETALSYHGHPLKVNIASMQGRRLTMEDKHLATSFSLQVNGKTHDLCLFGVFDGHSGSEAARFVEENLSSTLKYYLEEQPWTNGAKTVLDDVTIFNAVKLTFVDLDQRFSGPSGTCASVAFILDGNLWTANVGDSRIVLDNGGKTEQLTRDGKPGRNAFLKRIQKRGGDVYNVHGIPRVNARLAVGGAIGDHHMLGKNGEGCISPRPKITKIPLSEIKQGSRLIIACDGLWDVATSQEVVQAKASATALVNAAFAAGSADNISVMTIDF